MSSLKTVLSRRDALLTGGAALLAASLPALADDAKRKILVLGAGMSGLTAALSLLRRGHNVTIIEA